jgi:RNA polymerase sigma factor (sigma-70 family)
LREKNAKVKKKLTQRRKDAGTQRFYSFLRAFAFLRLCVKMPEIICRIPASGGDMLLKMTSDLDLLRRFARENSQDAFAEIVRRHLNLVYSAALRQIRSPQLAEEVAQSVFADLARVAATPSSPLRSRDASSPQTLTPWLYAVTRRTAIDAIRKESRRQFREQIAVEMNAMNAEAADWNQIEPLLDDAMAALDETDRSAILLRYFENKNLREVGEALGASEDAAQKRVSRAVDRLREFFSKHNVTIGASGLAVLISANAVQAAPVGLTSAISSAVLAETAATSTATITTKIIIMTTLQKTLVAASCIALAGTGIYGVFHLAKNHASIANSESSNSTGDYVSQEQFAFAGYATPESTIKSLFWIQSKGDFKATLESASPRFRAILEQAVKAAPNEESTIVNSIVAESKNFLGYRITDLKNISGDKIAVSVLVDDARLKQIGAGGKGYNALMAKSQKQWQLIRINSEWKYDGAPDSPRQ